MNDVSFRMLCNFTFTSLSRHWLWKCKCCDVIEMLMARYQEVCTPRLRSNKQYDRPSTRTVIVSSRNNKLIWRSTAKKQNNKGKKVRVWSIMRNHSQSYWKSTAECVVFFGRDLTAMRPVAVLMFCTCKVEWFIFELIRSVVVRSVMKSGLKETVRLAL
jgi:hypothetical protein